MYPHGLRLIRQRKLDEITGVLRGGEQLNRPKVCALEEKQLRCYLENAEGRIEYF
jgi:hypothetical protein